MDHFNYFVCIYALGKVLKKRGLKVIAVFFILLYLNTCTLFLSKRYETRRLGAFPWDALVYELLPKVRMSDKLSSHSKLV